MSKIKAFKVFQNDEMYPRQLFILEDQEPEFVYMAGNTELVKKPCISFCGARAASTADLKDVETQAIKAVQEGKVIVSGNAKGVDRTAHLTALSEGGNTILVLPTGIKHFKMSYDLKKVWDWERILLISQFEPEDPWEVHRAMQRNKVVVGLGNETLAFAVGNRGGTYNAVKDCLKYKIPVYTNNTVRSSQGTYLPTIKDLA